jgi:hypothetical protein
VQNQIQKPSDSPPPAPSSSEAKQATLQDVAIPAGPKDASKSEIQTTPKTAEKSELASTETPQVSMVKEAAVGQPAPTLTEPEKP